MRKKGNGRVNEQKKRRIKRIKENHIERQNDWYELIDGNITHYPVAYCTHYRGFLSLGLIETHKCKGCKRYKDFKDV